jgi:hypothetical protein
MKSEYEEKPILWVTLLTQGFKVVTWSTDLISEYNIREYGRKSCQHQMLISMLRRKGLFLWYPSIQGCLWVSCSVSLFYGESNQVTQSDPILVLGSSLSFSRFSFFFVSDFIHLCLYVSLCCLFPVVVVDLLLFFLFFQASFSSFCSGLLYTFCTL